MEEMLSHDLAHDLDEHFERLVETYQDQLYRFALRFCGSPQDAEEIAQDAFVRAYRALAGYEAERIGRLDLRPWLYRITLNVARNQRRRRRHPTEPLDGDTLPDGTDRDPAREAEAREGIEELERELLGLPPRYRAAVVLRHVEDLSYGEMAEVLEQPVGTVKSNVHRGVALLREALVQRGEKVRA